MSFQNAAVQVMGNLRPQRALVAFRCGQAIIRGLHDVGVVINGAFSQVHEFPMSTRPWQTRVQKPPKATADFLEPGDDTAVPAEFDSVGRLVARGRPGFTICHWGTTQAVEARDGAYALYPAPMLPAHIGCQTLPARDWSVLLNILGGYRPFPYLLRVAEVMP
jgi:hypothetical protein